MKSQRSFALLLFIIVSAIWGSAGPVIKYTLNFIPPIPFLTYRFALSAVLSVFLVSGTKKRLSESSWPLVFATSIVGLPIALTLFFMGLDRTSSVNGGLLTAFTPLVTTLMGGLILKEFVSHRERTGTAIAFLGAVLMVILPNLGGPLLRNEHLIGNFLVLGAIIADSGGAVMSRVLVRRKTDSVLFTNISFIISCLIMLPIMFMSYTPGQLQQIFKSMPIQAHLGVIYMSFISGTLAYILRNAALKYIQVSEASVILYLIPLFGLPLSLFWLHESFSWLLIPGIFFTFAGIYLSETSNKHR